MRRIALLFLLGCLAEDGATAKEEEEVPVVHVAEGEAVRVPCPLAARGASVQWLHEGVPVLAGAGRAWSVGGAGEAALAIDRARPSDAGQWACREALGLRRTAQVLVLEVHSVPFLEVEGRRLLQSATVTVKEPTSLLVHCVVRGKDPAAPPTDVQWFVGDSNVSSSAELFVEEESGGAWLSRSALPLNATRLLHGRKVVCRPNYAPSWAEEDAPYASAHLNVLYEPSFSISRSPGFGLPLVEGMRVSLECAVDANPPSAPAWVRDDVSEEEVPGAAGGGAALVFDPVERGRHAGWYRCTTRHPQFGFFASFGLFLNVRAADPTPPGEPPPGGGEDNCQAGGGGVSLVAVGGAEVSGVEGGGALLSAHVCSLSVPARLVWVVRQVALRPGQALPPYTAHELKAEEELAGCWLAMLGVSPLSASHSGEGVELWAEGSHKPAHFRLHVTQRAEPRSHSTPTSCASYAGVMATLLITAIWRR